MAFFKMLVEHAIFIGYGRIGGLRQQAGDQLNSIKWDCTAIIVVAKLAFSVKKNGEKRRTTTMPFAKALKQKSDTLKATKISANLKRIKSTEILAIK